MLATVSLPALAEPVPQLRTFAFREIVTATANGPETPCAKIQVQNEVPASRALHSSRKTC